MVINVTFVLGFNTFTLTPTRKKYGRMLCQIQQRLQDIYDDGLLHGHVVQALLYRVVKDIKITKFRKSTDTASVDFLF